MPLPAKKSYLKKCVNDQTFVFSIPQVFSDEEVGTEHIIQELRKAHSHDRLDDEASSNSEGGSSELPQNDDDDENEDTSAR